MARKAANITKPEHWNEWLSTCTAWKCNKEARDAFSKIAGLRYRKYLFKVLESKGIPPEKWNSDLRELEPKEKIGGVGPCWIDIEADPIGLHGRPKKLEQAKGDWSDPQKTYKKRFAEEAATADDPEAARNHLEAMLSNRIRTRCNKLLAAFMKHGIAHASLEGSSSGEEEHGENVVSEQTLPDETFPTPEDAASAAVQEAHRQAAREFRKTLKPIERAILFQKLMEKQISDPVLLDQVGLKKSRVSELFGKIQGQLRSSFGRYGFTAPEDRESLLVALKNLLEAEFSAERDPDSGMGGAE